VDDAAGWRLRLELRRLRADREQHRAVTRDRRATAARLSDDNAVQQGARGYRRIGLDHGLECTLDKRRPPAPSGREPRGAIPLGRFVAAQRVADPRVLPVAELRDARNEEVAGLRDPDA